MAEVTSIRACIIIMKPNLDKTEKNSISHTHITEDGNLHNHSHSEGHAGNHTHAHTHSHTQTKAVLNRMSRIIGHMEAIKTMVEDGRDCAEVLVQISAVRSALNGVGKVILKDHIEHCIVDAVKENDVETIDELKKAIDKFL